MWKMNKKDKLLKRFYIRQQPQRRIDGGFTLAHGR